MKFLTNLLKELYRKAENDIIKAQKGIIVFDNFDNIAYSGLRFYHQQLSEFISGKKYNINVGNNLDIQVIFDTSQLTFICLSKLNNENSTRFNKYWPRKRTCKRI